MPGSGTRTGLRLCIFDLDGTLVDSAPAVCDAVNAIRLERNGALLSVAEIAPFMCFNGEGMLERALGPLMRSPSGDLARFRALYGARPGGPADLYPGIAHMLEGLRATGVMLAVCTNKVQNLTEKVLKETGLDRLIAFAVGGDAVGRSKPDPGHVLAVLDRAGCRPDEAVYIGDSLVDADAAIGAGVTFVHAGWGYGRPGELCRHHAETVPLLAACLTEMIAGGERGQEGDWHVAAERVP